MHHLYHEGMHTQIVYPEIKKKNPPYATKLIVSLTAIIKDKRNSER